jgi:hypothetical protein
MATRIVISLNGGIVQDVFCTDPSAEVMLIDWDTQECDEDCAGLVDVGAERADVRAYVVSPWKALEGTDCWSAIVAANLLDSTTTAAPT